jgi:signal transduction histidine kinase
MNPHANGRHRRAETLSAGAFGDFAAPVGVVPPDSAAERRPGRGFGRRLRPRTVRAKVVSLLAMPVVALMTLWALATVTVVGDVLTVKQVAAIETRVRTPIDQTVAALQVERAAAVRFLNSPTSPATALAPQRSTTDTAVAAVRTGFDAARVEAAAIPKVQSGVSLLTADLDGLPALRDRVAARQIPAIDAYDAYTGAIGDARAVDATLVGVRSENTASGGTTAGAVLGLLAIVVSLLISVRIGRGLVGELVGLRNSALDLAGRRLPRAIARLRAGAEVDLAAEAPAADGLGYGDDEVGQVAEALAVVQRAALEAAVERAEVVSGVAGVFLNLARRSQTLVHRQLALLEAMERRIDDPGELEDLFRLDHLATRMRRHAEGLIILSGSPPGRGWRRPVPLMDVVRAASAEVEDFARVDVRRMPEVSVVGGAVADLTHLLAELVENATAFSPPHSRVVVRGQEEDGVGCVIEVEDRGLGMGRPALADANRRIADARPDDLFESDRLGLYVVSRLARRHGVEVVLRASAAEPGGTVAVVVLPVAVLAASDEGGSAFPPNQGAEPLATANGFRTATATGAAADVDVGISISTGTGTGTETGVGPRSRIPTGADPGSDIRGSAGAVIADHPIDAGIEADADIDTGIDTAVGHSIPSQHSAVGENGLPRRIRQASLAAQLRDRSHATQASDSSEAAAPLRSPDTVRATMSALQQGWTRGRGADPKENA